MRYLLDTCVLVELQRPRGDEQVRGRAAELARMQSYISVISIGELTRGIALVTGDDVRQRRLRVWIEQLQVRYSDQILPIDLEICHLWGHLTARAAQRGLTIPAADGLIAATALHHGLIVMTRNVRHFEESGVEVENPWNG